MIEKLDQCYGFYRLNEGSRIEDGAEYLVKERLFDKVVKLKVFDDVFYIKHIEYVLTGSIMHKELSTLISSNLIEDMISMLDKLGLISDNDKERLGLEIEVKESIFKNIFKWD
jgi:hypothetical protein